MAGFLNDQADLGLLGGVAEGFKQGMMAYQDAKKRQQDLALQKAKLDLEDQNRAEQKRYHDQQIESGYTTKGFIRDSSGNWVRDSRAPDVLKQQSQEEIERRKLGEKFNEETGRWEYDTESLANRKLESENAYRKGLINRGTSEKPNYSKDVAEIRAKTDAAKIKSQEDVGLLREGFTRDEAGKLVRLPEAAKWADLESKYGNLGERADIEREKVDILRQRAAAGDEKAKNELMIKEREQSRKESADIDRNLIDTEKIGPLGGRSELEAQKLEMLRKRAESGDALAAAKLKAAENEIARKEKKGTLDAAESAAELKLKEREAARREKADADRLALDRDRLAAQREKQKASPKALAAAKAKIGSSTENVKAGFATRMEQAEQMYNELAKTGYDRAGIFQSAGALLPEAIKPENAKKQKLIERAFLHPILRNESGAAVTEHEFEEYGAEYFPRAGDGKEIIEQKRLHRKQAIDNMKAAAGVAAQNVGLIPMKTTKGLSPGVIVNGFRFQGGDAKDKKNWIKVD